MLPASQSRAYQDFITLLTTLQPKLSDQSTEINRKQITQEFQELSHWFKKNIAQLSDQHVAQAIASRWQGVQTEILREFKLLTTDVLFLAISRQQTTQLKRCKSIDDRLSKLISYCQIMLKLSH